MKHFLDDTVVTITGGTGSFGSTLARKLLLTKVSEVRIFSRDENKQDALRNELMDKRLKFIIGDVRDLRSVEVAVTGSNYVFHSAALKQVPTCEFFPTEAVATNILGSENVIESSIRNKVLGLVCLSTDKAVYPINSMGMSKALMEKVAQSFARNHPDSLTKIAITRYGNVLMSRGSVVPLFINQIKKKVPLTITNPGMTRFIMSLDESIDLVMHAFQHGKSGDLFVRKAPACSVETIADAVSKIMGADKSTKKNLIGVRHGEKNFETLLGSEERNKAIENNSYFEVPLDTRSLDYSGYFSQGMKFKDTYPAFTSENTEQLDENQVIKKLLSLEEFKQMIAN